MDELIKEFVAVVDDYKHFPAWVDKEAHVRGWIDQFPEIHREEILRELKHVLDRYYISEASMDTFLKGIINHSVLTKGQPDTHWNGVKFLDIQLGGNSQKEMLLKMEQLLNDEHGIDINFCDSESEFFYIDDGLFSGGRVIKDLSQWIRDNSDRFQNQTIKINAVFAVCHTKGEFFLNQEIEKLGEQYGIDINLKVWACYRLVNSAKRKDLSDVLWPKQIPDTLEVNKYMTLFSNMGKTIIYRDGESCGVNKVFSTNENRELLEEQLFVKGVDIINDSGHFGVAHKPLGYTSNYTLGFGSLVITYRNCPNNAPLALWASTSNWNALFPRQNN